MSDRDWLVPSIVLTLVSGVIAILLIPSYAGIMLAVGVLPYWMMATAALAGIYGFFTMALARVESPFGRIREVVVEDWRNFSIISFGIFIAGVNLTTFMWTKPLLNYLVPFWADPVLADIDYWIFLGRDPWMFLTWLNTGPAAIFYHSGWLVMIILTLLIVLTAPPSPKKSATIVTYFLLWSVAGPVIHALIPAAGPVFFAELGYGDRFSGLRSVSETREMASYLWNIYSERGFGAGAGISAMPSLHIATTAWMMVAIRDFAPRLMIPMALAGLLIFMLSIALGWHYAVDGILGGGVALICYKVLRAFYSGGFGRDRMAAVAVG